METKNMIGTIVSLAVVVICVATIMMPVISDAQQNAGAETEKTNTSSFTSKVTYGSLTDEAKFFVDSTGIYYNDEDISGTALGFSIVTDSVSVIVMSSSSNAVQITTPEEQISTRPAWLGTYSITVTYSNGTVTIVRTEGDVTNTYDYSWIMLPSDTGEYITILGSTSVYVNDIEDVIYSGYYYTGEKDTGYSYQGGEISIYEDYEGSVDYTLTLVEGTTDIYTLSSFTFTIGGETFTPYYRVVKEVATGHEASGAAYSLYGAIPAIVIAGIMIASLGLVITAKRD